MKFYRRRGSATSGRRDTGTGMAVAMSGLADIGKERVAGTCTTGRNGVKEVTAGSCVVAAGVRATTAAMSIIVTSVVMTGVMTTEVDIIARQDKPKKVIAKVWLHRPDPMHPLDQARIHEPMPIRSGSSTPPFIPSLRQRTCSHEIAGPNSKIPTLI